MFLSGRPSLHPSSVNTPRCSVSHITSLPCFCALSDVKTRKNSRFFGHFPVLDDLQVNENSNLDDLQM